ncbi:MAG TPA: ABC transporter substrate binding protein [Acidobacteriota bacterium]|nr:ABC transporter substrate binding protein [Acidobacteriota bacterium]
MRNVLKLSSAILILFINSVHADIAVVKTAGIAAYDEARNGFSSICFENTKEFTLEDDLSNQTNIATEIQSGNYNVILALGARAAEFAKTNLPMKPVVFCMVVTSEVNALKADNVTGVSLDVHVKDQFAVLKSINKKIKRIGAIYTQPANNSLISSARTIATDLNLELVTSAISNGQDIQRAMGEVIDKVDALWIPPDPSLNSEEVIRYIGQTSLTKQKPCVGPSERYVRSGAIFSMTIDSVEAGRMAGDLANKIVQGTPLSKLPVQEMKRPKIIINTRAAGLLGLTIPKNVLDAAHKVYQ